MVRDPQARNQELTYWIPGVGRVPVSQCTPEQLAARGEWLTGGGGSRSKRRSARATCEPVPRLVQDVIVELLSFEPGMHGEINAGDPEWNELLDQLADWLAEARAGTPLSDLSPGVRLTD